MKASERNALPPVVKWVLDRCDVEDDEVDGCYVWKQCTSRSGRPTARYKTEYIHPQRAVYEAMVAPVPQMKLQLDVDVAGFILYDRLYVRRPTSSKQRHVIKRTGGDHDGRFDAWFVPVHAKVPEEIVDLIAHVRSPTLELSGKVEPRGIKMICGDPLCCNWRHMRPATHLELMRDARRDNRFPSGHLVALQAKRVNRSKKHVKVTMDVARKIHALVADGRNLKEVAAETGLKYANVWDVARGRTWRDTMPAQWAPLPDHKKPVDRRRAGR